MKEVSYIRKISKRGNSLQVVIPSDIAKKYHMEKGSQVEISDYDGRGVIIAKISKIRMYFNKDESMDVELNP